MKKSITLLLAIACIPCCYPLIAFCQEGSAARESASAEAENADAGSDAGDEQQELIEKLERYLTGVKFIGQFTVTGMEEDAPTAEEYTIKKAEKTPDGDYWLLTVRIKYGDNDIEMILPPIEIKWADGTPVITVDQISIPGLGTFDARVLIRNNKYAGTWQHDSVGGHLFGRIERIEDSDEDSTEGGDEMEEPGAITIQHILIGFAGSVPGKSITRSPEEALKLVDEIKQKLADGADFDELVREHTDDSHPGIYKMVNHGEQGSRAGGDPSQWIFKRNEMVAGFGDVGFTLEVDGVGVAEYDAESSPFGYHIIKRIE
ncbi:MAG: peptidylprolyl isomerase [Planctomycetota bacterium]